MEVVPKVEGAIKKTLGFKVFFFSNEVTNIPIFITLKICCKTAATFNMSTDSKANREGT